MLWIKNKVGVFQREIFSHRERRSFSTVLRKVENCELFKWFIFANLFLSNAHVLKNGLFQNRKLLAKSGNLLIICSEVLWMKKQHLQWFSVNYWIQHNLKKVFMEIHFHYWCVAWIFFSLKSMSQKHKVTFWPWWWCFLWMHTWPHQR